MIDFSVEDHRLDLIERKQLKLELFHRVEVLRRGEADIVSGEVIAGVVQKRGIGPAFAGFEDGRSEASRFFEKLAFRGFDRGFSGLQAAGRKFEGHFFCSETKLSDHDDLVILRDGDDVHPVSRFEHVEEAFFSGFFGAKTDFEKFEKK